MAKNRNYLVDQDDDYVEITSEGEIETKNTDLETKIDTLITRIETLTDKIPVDTYGNLEVKTQDQFTRLVDTRLAKVVTGPYTVAQATTPNTYTITLDSATGLNTNDKVGIFQDSTNPGSYFGYIKSINGNTLTLNVPFDISFGTNAVLYEIINNMGVNGSSTPQVFDITNGSEIPIDINRILLKMITTDAPGFGKFGDLTALTNGIVLRKNNGDGTYENIMEARNNSELALYAYDYTTYSATNPAQGVNGLALRFTFNGQDKHGVVVRLLENQKLECVIQDDLSDLIDFKIMAEGSYTDEV